ncbi:hypothetical protein R1flu_016789 [Riccia fluitans]|uniref:Uncharacterized protein n=1 Tax=Riccia fluitans TaxID=41844 RepID=A0ABD1YMV2_9MARC
MWRAMKQLRRGHNTKQREIASEKLWSAQSFQASRSLKVDDVLLLMIIMMALDIDLKMLTEVPDSKILSLKAVQD